jgi:hypothetical protein
LVKRSPVRLFGDGVIRIRQGRQFFMIAPGDVEAAGRIVRQIR